MADITPNTPNPVREDSYKTELATKLGIDAQYIPSSPVWRNEEEIAAIAEMFSNMTAGSSSGGVLVVHATDNAGIITCDKTWQEIHDAALVGPVILLFDSSGSFTHNYLCVVSSDGGYAASFYDANYGVSTFSASSASGYLVLGGGS